MENADIDFTMVTGLQQCSRLYELYCPSLPRNMALDAAAFAINVPTDRLIKLAKNFRNTDVFATFFRKVTSDAAINMHKVQMMKTIVSLEGEWNDLNGMKNAGKIVAGCITPFLSLPLRTNDEDKMTALFNISNDDVTAMTASEERILSQMDASATQVREKIDKEGRQGNYRTTFYMLMVFVKYYPSRGVFDFYTSYVYCEDTSVFQWTRNAVGKKKRLASLELEGVEILPRQLSGKYPHVIAVLTTDAPFKGLEMELNPNASSATDDKETERVSLDGIEGSYSGQ